MTVRFDPELPGRRPLVAGAARSGLAAARLLRRAGLAPRVCDRRPADQATEAAASLASEGIETVWGADGPELLEGRDLVVWSPGIPIAHPLAQAARLAGIPVLSELEVGWRASRAPFVCITGTNGKSTTTDLAGALIRASGRSVAVCGNIGRPVCETAPNLPPDGVAVAEVSSFQLETVDALKPQVAAWLNLTPDHLDRHGDLETYAAMKRRLFLRQDASDTAVWNADDPEVMKRRIPDDVPAAPRGLFFSVAGPTARGAWVENEALVMGEPGRAAPLLPTSELQLRGRHNLSNATAALCCAAPFAVPRPALVEALRSYPGLEHRLEPAGVVGGVEFVNDSKATNVGSLEVALQSFGEPVVLIAGGRGKGQDFRPLAALVRRTTTRVILFGEDAAKIADAWAGAATMMIPPSLELAVDAAFLHALRPGAGSRPARTVLFSPGCASFDMFRDYEDRGRQFKAQVERLQREGVAS
jgi:UDP-N-acetylmuramoylalanine--D-glutamate ligase